MKAFLRVLLVILALPVFLVGGFFVAGTLYRAGFEPAEEAEPPRWMAVAATWEDEDGQFACRAFYWHDLLERPDTAPELRFRLSDEELGACSERFRTFSREHRWPREFEWEGGGYFASVRRAEPPREDAIIVSYPPSDEHTAQTRYRIDPVTGQPTDFEYRGFFGPAHGLGVVVFGGGGGIVAWIAMLFLLGVRALRTRGS